MFELYEFEVNEISGGVDVIQIYKDAGPWRYLTGSFALGFDIGTSIYNVYGNNIQNALDYVFRK